jgi:hypothetical protein
MHRHALYFSRRCTEGTKLYCDSLLSANRQTNMSTANVSRWSTHSSTQMSVLDEFMIPGIGMPSTFLDVVPLVASYIVTRYSVPTDKPTCRLQKYPAGARIVAHKCPYLTNLWCHGIGMPSTLQDVIPKVPSYPATPDKVPTYKPTCRR